MTATTLPPSLAHGTATAYCHHRCRCDDCRAIKAEQARNRTRLKAYGRWQPFVPAGPVREHLDWLAGQRIGIDAVTAATGLNRCTITRIRSGPSGGPPPDKVRSETAAAILAVTPERARLNRSVVDPGPTLRRLRSLMADGWSGATLAGLLGIGRQHLARIIKEGRDVTAGTARKIAALYGDLRGQTPTGRLVVKTRNHAASKGWLPSSAWYADILDMPSVPGIDPGTAEDREAAIEASLAAEYDDVELAPDDDVDWALVQRVLDGQRVSVPAEDRAGMVYALRDAGLTVTQVCEALRLSNTAVKKIIRARAGAA